MQTEAQRKTEREQAIELRRAEQLPTLEAPPAPKPKQFDANTARPRSIGVTEHAGVVPRRYAGRNAVLMATGPSLTEEVIEQIRPYHEDGTVVVFGCNDTYRICPFLDVHYACDPPWWDLHVHRYSIADHPAVKWTQDRRIAEKYTINWVLGTSGSGLNPNANMIHFGGNSGYQLINLALLYGIEQFALCGYNMSIPVGKPAHFFGMHEKPLSQAQSFSAFISAFDTIQDMYKARIANCTPDSALRAFKKRPLSEVLAEWRFQRSTRTLLLS